MSEHLVCHSTMELCFLCVEGDMRSTGDVAMYNTTFEYLKNLEPKSDDGQRDLLTLDIDQEIEKLQEEMDSIEITEIPFDKWDYIMAFSLGVLEVAGDFLVGDHNHENSLAYQMSDPNTKLGAAFKEIHEKMDHAGQPLDYQGKGFGGGDHRGRTFAHDMLMFPLTMYMLHRGKFIDVYYEDGIRQIVNTCLNQFGNNYKELSYSETIIAYFTHMLADFFSAKSLPIPGFSLLTHFPEREVRQFANDLYKDGLNMRNLLLQGIPVATVELLMWIWFALRYKDSEYSKEQIKSKRELLLLLSHSIATTVNVNKVIITREITTLNLPMVIRTVQLSWKAIEHEAQVEQYAIEKVTLANVKNQLETVKTLVLLEDALFYTNQIDEMILGMKGSTDKRNAERRENNQRAYSEMEELLAEIKALNDKEV